MPSRPSAGPAGAQVPGPNTHRVAASPTQGSRRQIPLGELSLSGLCSWEQRVMTPLRRWQMRFLQPTPLASSAFATTAFSPIVPVRKNCRGLLIAHATGHNIIPAPDLSASLEAPADAGERFRHAIWEPCGHPGLPLVLGVPASSPRPSRHRMTQTPPLLSARLHHASLPAAVPLLVRTLVRQLPRSVSQPLHDAPPHADITQFQLLLREPQPAPPRTATPPPPHTAIPIPIGARFSSINSIRPGPGDTGNGQRSLFAGPTRIDSSLASVRADPSFADDLHTVNTADRILDNPWDSSSTPRR